MALTKEEFEVFKTHQYCDNPSSGFHDQVGQGISRRTVEKGVKSIAMRVTMVHFRFEKGPCFLSCARQWIGLLGHFSCWLGGIRWPGPLPSSCETTNSRFEICASAEKTKRKRSALRNQHPDCFGRHTRH